MVKIPHFHCRGMGAIPGQGTKILHPTCHTIQPQKKKKKKREREKGIIENVLHHRIRIGPAKLPTMFNS